MSAAKQKNTLYSDNSLQTTVCTSMDSQSLNLTELARRCVGYIFIRLIDWMSLVYNLGKTTGKTCSQILVYEVNNTPTPTVCFYTSTQSISIWRFKTKPATIDVTQ